MMKFVHGVLAATLSVPALATDNGWAGLDQEIESLTASLSAAETTGPRLGGWLRVSYRHSEDDFHTGGAGAPDQSGFQFDRVRVELTGEVGDDYGYKISFDVSDGNRAGHGASPNGPVTLRDAYATWQLSDRIKGQIGRFKEPIVASGLVSRSRLVFLDRTAIGDALAGRDLGAGLNGHFDVVNWWLVVQDGIDGQADERKYTARFSADIAGTSGKKLMEGAYGASDQTVLRVGVAWQSDTALDDGTLIAGEVGLNTGPFSIAAETVDFDDGTAGAFGRTILINDPANTTPWDVTATFLITPEFELAGRYEDTDDVDNTTSFSFSLNYYVHGHDIKWVFQWRKIKTDDLIGDSDQLGLGLTVAY